MFKQRNALVPCLHTTRADHLTALGSCHALIAFRCPERFLAQLSGVHLLTYAVLVARGMRHTQSRGTVTSWDMTLQRPPVRPFSARQDGSASSFVLSSTWTTIGAIACKWQLLAEGRVSCKAQVPGKLAHNNTHVRRRPKNYGTDQQAPVPMQVTRTCMHVHLYLVCRATLAFLLLF